MHKSASWVLRIGLSITFFWIGMMILQDPLGWFALVRPWAAALVPGSPAAFMQETAMLDVAVAIMLLIPQLEWVGALVGTIHLLTVMLSVDVADFLVRDIGLLGAASALLIDSFPSSLLDRMKALLSRRSA
ncbi:MAG: hypothetical protein KGI60_04765 [Patescibacteria group bacterium]|nr:hypothetical protein [Patescibacteria group bacterium]